MPVVVHTSDAETHSSAQQSSAPSEELRADHLLLERLKNEPPIKPQLPAATSIVVILLVIALGAVVYFISKRPEKFAEDPHPQSAQHQSQEDNDSSEIVQKRMHFAPMLDSLQTVVKEHPDDLEAQLQFANVLYEAEFWNDAKEHYEIYLKANPKATGPRVDYSFVLIQATHDFKRGLDEIEKVLAIDPNHVRALFKAGLYVIQVVKDRKEGLAKSEAYFRRAHAAAEKEGDTVMLENTEKVLQEIEKIKAEGTQQ